MSPLDQPSAGHATFAGASPLVSRRTNRWLWLAYLFLLLWFAYGAFPISEIHGDATQEVVGVENIVRHGWDGPVLTHNTKGCPGVTMTLLALRRLTGVHTSILFGLFSLASGVLLSVSAGGLLRRLTGVPAPLASMIVLFFPIIAVLGMYSNDMVTAAALTVTAMWILSGPTTPARLLAGALCLSLGGWYRADAILVTGTIPLLLYRGALRETVKNTLVVGCAAAGLALIWVHLSGTSITAMVRHARAVTMIGPALVPTIMFYMTFFPLAAYYGLFLGVRSIIRRRQWHLAALAAMGTVPVWLVMLNKPPYPKFYTHTVPWITLVICLGLRELWVAPPSRSRRVHVAILGVLAAGQCLLGIQIELRAKPWWYSTQRILANIVQIDPRSGPLKHAALVVGPGTLNPMGHAGIPGSGYLFTPLAFREEHEVVRDFMNDYVAFVRDLDRPTETFFSTTHTGVQSTIYALVENGHRCVAYERFGPPDSWRIYWGKGDQRYTQYRIGGATFDMTFWRSIGALHGIYVASTGREEATVLEQTTRAEPIIRWTAKGVRAVYDVTFPPIEGHDD